MHLKVLSQWLADRLVIGHSTRTAALRSGGKLSLTHLGRSLNGSAHVKHQIKAVDRLLGNRHLQRERDGIYRAIVQTLLLGSKRPVIVVDWADFELGRQWLMLKAAVPVGGRAISLYERVFPFKRYNSPGAHREFLRALERRSSPGLPPDHRHGRRVSWALVPRCRVVRLGLGRQNQKQDQVLPRGNGAMALH
jgi:hypothetical protein